MPGPYLTILLSEEGRARAQHGVKKASKHLVNCAFAWRDRDVPPLPADKPLVATQYKRGTTGDVLATIVRGQPEDPAAERERLVDFGKMLETLANSDGGTSCHDQAIALMGVLRAGPVTFSADRAPLAADLVVRAQNDEAFLAGAARFIGGRATCCVRIRTNFHSFVLIKNGTQVESIEGWAGTDGGSFSLDECLADPVDVCPSGDCLVSIGHLLDPSDAVRNEAFARFSQAGNLYFTEDAVKTMTIEVAPLKTPAEFLLAVGTLLDAAAVWEAFLRKNARRINKAVQLQRDLEALEGF